MDGNRTTNNPKEPESTPFPCPNVIDLNQFQTMCNTNLNNPKIGYLNVNHFRNKVVDLRCILKDIEFTYLAIAETKIDNSFSSTQFNIDGYLCPKEFRRDRTNKGGGMLVYIRKGTPCKRLNKFECDEIETVVIEIRVGKQKWCIVSVYRNEQITVDSFLKCFSKSLDIILDEYENLIVIGDLNINSLKKHNFDTFKFEKLKNFCDSYDLSNLIKGPTCFQSDDPSSIDLILTNKNRSFINSKSVVNGLSDHHSLVCTMLKTTITKLKPVKVNYRSFKNFDESKFIKDLETKINKIDFSKPKNDFTKFFKEFEQVTNKHAPMKTKIIRGNDAPFVTVELRKEIRHRSRLCNIARKVKTAEAKLAFTKQRNKCTRIRRENQKAYFENIKSENNKRFWKTIGPYMNDKGNHGHEDYILEEKGELFKEPNIVGDLFCEYYTNIVEHTTGIPPIQIPTLNNGDLIDDILDYYKEHSSIQEIANMDINHTFKLPLAIKEELIDIISKLDISKATMWIIFLQI